MGENGWMSAKQPIFMVMWIANIVKTNEDGRVFYTWMGTLLQGGIVRPMPATRERRHFYRKY
jgi:hypothetical protein